MDTNEARTEPRTNNHVYGERAFWVKGDEAQMANQKMLTVILRPGDRSDPVKTPLQHLPLATPVPVYCISRPGDQEKGIEAQFEPDMGLTVRIIHRVVKPLGEIYARDLGYQDGFAVPKFSEQVLLYLEKELAPGKQFTPESLITIYYVEYLPDETPATD